MEKENDIDIKDEDLKEDDFTPEELEAENVDWKAKAQELKGIAKRRATQLNKVKGKLGEYETKLKEFQPKPQDKEDINKSSEPDYGKLAYLQSRQIDNPDDQKDILAEAERLKLPLTDILSMEHIQTRLKASQEAREAKAGMPRGQNRAGGSTQHDVDYWIQKGDTPEDQELAEKVVNARLAKEVNKKFSPELYVG